MSHIALKTFSNLKKQGKAGYRKYYTEIKNFTKIAVYTLLPSKRSSEHTWLPRMMTQMVKINILRRLDAT